MLVSSYFDIVRKEVSDIVPKTIMHFLVNITKEQLQNELVSQLYQKDAIEDMLSEAPEVVERRRHCKQMLDVLRRAQEIVNEVRDTAIM